MSETERTRKCVEAVQWFARNLPVTYHLGTSGGDSEWAPIKCGGGVMFPGRRVEVSESRVCQECLAADSEARS